MGRRSSQHVGPPPSISGQRVAPTLHGCTVHTQAMELVDLPAFEPLFKQGDPGDCAPELPRT